MRNRLKKIDLCACIICIIWCIVTICVQKFCYHNLYLAKKVIACKIISFLCLYFGIQLFKFVIHNRKVTWVKHWCILSGVMFLYLFCFLLLVWPGTWSWDDIQVLNAALNFQLVPWQHFLSSVFHILCLQIFPFATGVIIVQIILASVITGYCVSKVIDSIELNGKKRIIVEILFMIPCVFPPLMEYLFSGFRMGIYSYLELLLITKFYLAYRSKELAKVDLMQISFLTVLVAAWRTEGIYYIAVLFFVLLFYGRKKIAFRNTLIVTFVVGFLVLVIGKYNNRLIGNDTYSLTATLYPVVELVKQADGETDQEELEAIGKIVDMNYLEKSPEAEGEKVFWCGGIKPYSKQVYREYLQAYGRLIFKYPKVLGKSIWRMFMQTSGVSISAEGYTKQRTTLLNTSGGSLNLFDASKGGAWGSTNSIWKNPVSHSVRNKVLRLIACVDEEGKVNVAYRFFWNLCIPVILLLLCSVINLLRKDWIVFLSGLAVLIRIPLVAMTACAPYIMYYLSVYLLAYFLSMFTVVRIISKKKE